LLSPIGFIHIYIEKYSVAENRFPECEVVDIVTYLLVLIMLFLSLSLKEVISLKQVYSVEGLQFLKSCYMRNDLN